MIETLWYGFKLPNCILEYFSNSSTVASSFENSACIAFSPSLPLSRDKEKVSSHTYFGVNLSNNSSSYFCSMTPGSSL
jgi:hypothetical protein